jgi:hypothetical protein
MERVFPWQEKYRNSGKDNVENRQNCSAFNPLNAELNSICYLLALLGVHHILHISRIRVKYALFL